MTHMIERGTADAINRTAEEVYDAECALHAARQTHVDAWIAAAGDRLHEALVRYLAAIAAAPAGNAPGAATTRPDPARTDVRRAG